MSGVAAMDAADSAVLRSKDFCGFWGVHGYKARRHECTPGGLVAHDMIQHRIWFPIAELRREMGVEEVFQAFRVTTVEGH